MFSANSDAPLKTDRKQNSDQVTISVRQRICDQLTMAFRFQDMKMEEGFEGKPDLNLETVQNQILNVKKRNEDLFKELKQYKAELERKRAETARLREKFKICLKVPQVDINFDHRHEQWGGDLIRVACNITQKPSMLLQAGEALITFEEERVASRVQNIPSFSVSCDSGPFTVKPRKICIPSFKFEVHLDIYKKELLISDVFSTMEEKSIKRCLELSFYKPSRGGGEVEKVEYDEKTGRAKITFLQPGVALRLAQAGTFQVNLEPEKMVNVEAIFKTHLHEFKTFCASPRTTVLLSSMKELTDEDHQQEYLEVYFQKPSHGGGEIEHIRYNSKRKPVKAFFSCDNVTKVHDTSRV